MLQIDPIPYTPFAEEHWVLTDRQKSELDGFRAAHPELADWTRGQVRMAWSVFSEEAHFAGSLAMFPERNEEFLAYLVGKARGLFSDEHCDQRKLDAFRNELFHHG
jgi:hypothetical protein